MSPGRPGRSWPHFQPVGRSGHERAYATASLAALRRAPWTTLRAGLALKIVSCPGERVDALALLGGRLLDHDHAHEPGYDEDATLLQLGMADAAMASRTALDVLAGELVGRLVGENRIRADLERGPLAIVSPSGLGGLEAPVLRSGGHDIIPATHENRRRKRL